MNSYFCRHHPSPVTCHSVPGRLPSDQKQRVVREQPTTIYPGRGVCHKPSKHSDLQPLATHLHPHASISLSRLCPDARRTDSTRGRQSSRRWQWHEDWARHAGGLGHCICDTRICGARLYRAPLGQTDGRRRIAEALGGEGERPLKRSDGGRNLLKHHTTAPTRTRPASLPGHRSCRRACSGPSSNHTPTPPQPPTTTTCTSGLLRAFPCLDVGAGQ